MKFRTVSALSAIALSAITLVAAGVLAQAEEKPASAAARQFEALKKLAGDWVEVGKDGKPTDELVSSFRVTAAGTALEERLFPDGDKEKEMVTMYFLDGDDLMLTHYCTLGNQPRLRAERSDDAERIAFKFAGATNLKSEDEPHIHDATFTITGPDRFTAEWVACKGGETCHQVKLELARKQK